MKTITCLLAILWVLVVPARAEQAPPRDIPAEDLARWDTSSRMYNKHGDLLTTVSVKNGKLDLSRPDGHTRNDFLKSLYAQGLKQFYAPFVSKLEIDAQGRLLLRMSLNVGVGQTLTEREDGFDLVNADGSQLFDRKGRLLATVTTVEAAAALALPEGTTLESTYASGLRVFYYRAGYVKGEPVLIGIQLSRDSAGKVVLKP